jgi:hypothetical protein
MFIVEFISAGVSTRKFGYKSENIIYLKKSPSGKNEIWMKLSQYIRK